MKIRDINAMMTDSAPKTLSEDKRVGLDPSRSFHRTVTSLGQAEFVSQVNSKLDAISRQGEIVAKRADIRELQKYRQMISELLGESVSNSFEFQKSSHFDARGRHRVFATVKRINATLDEMTSAMLGEEKDNLNLLDRVDDIRGLLIDLFV